MVNRIACFLTCGYTEAGAMQSFLRKINDNYEFRQFLPNKTIKKKGMSKDISNKISGLTGKGLLSKIYDILEKHKDEINDCKAIIIEDDLDGKFYGWSQEKIELYKQSIIDRIHSILGSQLPVFILYASPEIESWFLSDWNGSFEYVYAGSDYVPDVERSICLFYIHHLRRYVFQILIKEYASNIEDYGYFEGKYNKLSEQLMDAVQFDVKEYIQTLPGCSETYKNQIVQSKYLYYSKKRHGDRMLRNINPKMVADNCRKYFAPVYYKLCNF